MTGVPAGASPRRSVEAGRVSEEGALRGRVERVCVSMGRKVPRCGRVGDRELDRESGAGPVRVFPVGGKAGTPLVPGNNLTSESRFPTAA